MWPDEVDERAHEMYGVRDDALDTRQQVEIKLSCAGNLGERTARRVDICEVALEMFGDHYEDLPAGQRAVVHRRCWCELERMSRRRRRR